MVTQKTERSRDWDPSAPAPDGLEQVRQFVNTLDLYRGRDGLADVRQAVPTLRRLGLLSPTQSLSVDDLAELRELRRAIRALKFADPGARSLSSFDLVLRVHSEGGSQLCLVGTKPGIWGSTAEMVGALYAAQTLGQLSRFKTCANPNCHWFFWDASRPGTGRWCSMKICGGQNKSRSYRHRTRA